MSCPYRRVLPNGEVFTPATHSIRADIPAPPPRMRHLPIDRRGYPVPFFVAWPNEEPEFRASDSQAVALCVGKHLCWVCGTPLWCERVFTIGPMCAINRVSSEPPAHIACARYSARACPFLTKPRMVRRENDLPEAHLPGAGISIRRNPGVTLLWFARQFAIEVYPEGRLWRFTSSPVMVEWYAQGRKATRQEVLDSIESGLPALEEMARMDGTEAEQMLQKQKVRAMRLLPKR